MKDFVIIPAYNEGERISEVVEKVKKYCSNIIVVDDGSKDETYKHAKEKGAKVLRHLVNMGKGSALKTGCDFALWKGADRIIVMDADGQHKAEDIPRFLEELKDKDIVFSYRKRSEVMPFVLKFGNDFINKILKKTCGGQIKDSQCGYRAFTTDAYRKIRWNSMDYYMETEMIINASKHKLRYSQLPIDAIYSDRFKGTTVFDGVKIVTKIIGGRLLR